MDELPTIPAAYWAPDLSRTRVYYLRFDGSWGLYGVDIPTHEVPMANLKLLGYYYPEQYIKHGVEVPE